MPCPRRTFALLVLATTLALSASWPGAAPAHAQPAALRPADSAVASWNPWTWLRAVLARAWSKAGCSIDPYGQCIQGSTVTPPPALRPKSGCSIDPFGQCIGALPARPPIIPQRDEGCSIDPYGGGCAGGR
ncbi:MAG TPA: hypothetical protein VHQ90_10490 [Thermoanaerobaculia bacterium]|nr:hypothetical protein [Thermoanaerobaculia bacterium]